MTVLDIKQQIGILAATFRLKGYNAAFRLMPLHSQQLLSSGTMEKCLTEYVANADRRQTGIADFRLLSDVRIGKPSQVYTIEFELSHGRDNGFRVDKLKVHSLKGISSQRMVNGIYELPHIQQLVLPITHNNRQRVLPPPMKRRRGL